MKILKAVWSATCNHGWVPWSGKQRCRLCGATQ